MPTPSDTSGQRGFALVPVLWIAGLLAVLAASFSLSVRTMLRATANIVESEKAEALADGGVMLAVLDLVRSRREPGGRRFAPGSAHSVCDIAGEGRLLIAVNDEAGKIDVNSAGVPLLVALMVGLGEPPDRATRTADAILDFRDADDDRRPNGAESADYRSAGLHWGPKNAPLQSVEELGQVRGMTSALLSRMTPHIGIHSGLSGLDPSVASSGLLAMLRAGLEGSAGSFASFPELDPTISLPAMFVAPSPMRFYAIEAQAATPSGAVFVRKAIVDLGAPAQPGHVFLRWTRGGSPIATSTEAVIPPKC